MTTDQERRAAAAAAVKVGDELIVTVDGEREQDELAQRPTAPLPRGTVHAATIVDAVYRGLITDFGCEMDKLCVGAIHIRLATTHATIHLRENERVALIEALGGVA